MTVSTCRLVLCGIASAGTFFRPPSELGCSRAMVSGSSSAAKATAAVQHFISLQSL